MKGALRYLFDNYVRTSLASVGTFGLLSLLGSPVLKIEFFSSYYYMMPMILVIFTVIFSFNITTIYRNMALSMNCLRRHFFWGCQAAFAAVALAGTAIVWLTGALPGLTGLGYMAKDVSPVLSGAPAYSQPGPLLFLLAASALLQPTGAALGGVYGRSKAWATVLLVIVILLGIAGTVLMLFVNDGTLSLPPAVPVSLLCALAVICAGCEVYFWRSNARTVVR